MKQYLSLLLLAAAWTACQTNAATRNGVTADSIAAPAPQPAPTTTITERPIDSFRIGTKKFMVYNLDRPSLKPVADLDYDSAEGSQLAKNQDKVKRQGDSLLFSLHDGKTAVLSNAKNPTQEDEYAVYYYAGYLEDMRHHLAFGGYYESSDFVVVNPANGKQTHMWGIPYISPDKQFVICPSFDLEVGFNNNGFELYSYQNGNVQLLGEVNLKTWGPGQVKWIDKRTMETEYQTFDANMTLHSKPVKIVML